MGLVSGIPSEIPRFPLRDTARLRVDFTTDHPVGRVEAWFDLESGEVGSLVFVEHREVRTEGAVDSVELTSYISENVPLGTYLLRSIKAVYLGGHRDGQEVFMRDLPALRFVVTDRSGNVPEEDAEEGNGPRVRSVAWT